MKKLKDLKEILEEREDIFDIHLELNSGKKIKEKMEKFDGTVDQELKDNAHYVYGVAKIRKAFKTIHEYYILFVGHKQACREELRTQKFLWADMVD